MKKVLRTFLSLLMLLSIIICMSVPAGAETLQSTRVSGKCSVLTVAAVNTSGSDSKSTLLKKIKKKTNLTVTNTYYADYDGDGKKEMFAVAGGVGYDPGDREIWFASTSQVKCLESTNLMVYTAGRAKVSSKQSLFICEVGAGGSGSSSRWYYVKDGKAKGNTQSFSGLAHTSGVKFTCIENAFDGMKDSSGISVGHTYKKYYLKWKGTKFACYKGKAISKDTLKKYKNGTSVLKKIKKQGYTVDKIYKRSNGVININIHKASSGSIYYENVNLKLKDNSVKVMVIYEYGSNIVEKSSYGGIYKASIL